MERKSGILMPIFSLPSKYGIGSFGKECYKFIDFLKASGQKVWQILPLVQTGYGNSPYSSVSQESFNPYFISPEVLKEKGYINDDDLVFSIYDGEYIDYGFLYQVRYPMLRKAFSRFDKNNEDFIKYVKSKKSEDYAIYMALKYESGQKHFYEWADEFKRRDTTALKKFKAEFKEEILFWEFIQYEAESEWLSVKSYANKNGIEIMGDMPLYVALDSVDVWTNPNLFKLDENFMPKKKAGVPPDYFSADGQLWGNPVYNYEEHKKDNFKWWVKRVKNALKIFDTVRIDHFRGLDRYYEIDSTETTARNGEWVKVPSNELFSALHKKIDKTRIIAEDLGIIDDGVRELLKSTGYPGMKVLSFAFNGEENNPYLPQNIEENSVCYTGTHDNDTLKGLLDNFSEWDKNNFYNGVKFSCEKTGVEFNPDNLIETTIKLGLKGKSKLFIMPMQDILEYGEEYRINAPGSVKPQNWAIKFKEQDFSLETAKKIKELTKKSKR